MLDGGAAVALVCGVALLGISGPRLLMQVYAGTPWVFWSLLGAIAPFTVSKVVGGSIVRGRFARLVANITPERAGEDASLARDLELAAVRIDEAAARLRAEAVRVIQVRASGIVRNQLRARHRTLLRAWRELLRDDMAACVRLPSDARSWFDVGGQDIPVALEQCITRAEASSHEYALIMLSGPVARTPNDRAVDRVHRLKWRTTFEALVVALLEIEVWEPLEAISDNW